MARQLVIHGVLAGLSTAGELIERVQRLDTMLALAATVESKSTAPVQIASFEC